MTHNPRDREEHMTSNNPEHINAPEMTIIGRDTQIKGEMFFEKSARILGSFEGKITAQGEVQISSGANCNAAIEAQRVIVDGQVNGPISAHEQLTLTENARVQGDLTAGTLVVAEGASFVGHCNVGPAAQEILNGTQSTTNTAPASNQELKGSNLTTKLDLTPPWANQTNQQPQTQSA